MGGNIFNTPRIPKKVYNEISNDVSTKLRTLKKFVRIPDTFHNKTDYGDIDFVVENPVIDKDTIQQLFDIDESDISINTSVVSFKYRDAQCDICHFPEQDVESALAYYRMSDCSNMIGQIFRAAMGYRYTHQGLVYPVKFNHDDCLGEVLVSKNTKKIMDFINLDWAKWNEGFYDEVDLFEWIIKSKYFNKQFFTWESLNHQSRTRDRKRKTFSMFVDWLKDRECVNNHVPTINKQEHLFRGMFHFYEEDDWTRQIEPLIEQRYIWERARNIFNGSIIQELTGTSGPMLGKILRDFNEYLSTTYHLTKAQGWGSITYFVADRTKEEMVELFNKWYKTYEH